MRMDGVSTPAARRARHRRGHPRRAGHRRPRSRPRPASPTCRPSSSRPSPARSPGTDVDYRALEPLGPGRAGRGAGRPRPRLPPADRAPHGARRARAAADPGRSSPTASAKYAEALGVQDDFVRVARRYAQGAYGLAWMDLAAQRLRRARARRRRRRRRPAASRPPRSSPPRSIPRSRPAGRRSPSCRPTRSASRSGRCTTAAASTLPGRARRRADVPRAARLRARARRLRHEPQGRARGVRVHRSGRSRPEGLRVAGHADRAVRDRLHREHGLLRPRRPRAHDPGAGHAPPRRRRASGAGKIVCQRTSKDLFDVDYHELWRTARRRGPPACSACRRSRRPRSTAGPPVLFDLDGHVGDASARASRNAGEAPGEPELHADDRRCAPPTPRQLIELLEQWDLDQAHADIMGYMGMHLLADRENPGHYLIVADFGVVDPDVSAADEAVRNNDRPETQATAARLRELSTASRSTATTTRSTAPIAEPAAGSGQRGATLLELGDLLPGAPELDEHLLGVLAVVGRPGERERRAIELRGARHERERSPRSIHVDEHVVGDNLGVTTRFRGGLHDHPRRRQRTEPILPFRERPTGEDLVDDLDALGHVRETRGTGSEARVVEQVATIDHFAEVLEVPFGLDPREVDLAPVASRVDRDEGIRGVGVAEPGNGVDLVEAAGDDTGRQDPNARREQGHVDDGTSSAALTPEQRRRASRRRSSRRGASRACGDRRPATGDRRPATGDRRR